MTLMRDPYFLTLTGWTREPLPLGRERIILHFAEGGRVEIETTDPVRWIEPSRTLHETVRKALRTVAEAVRGRSDV